MTKSFKHEKEKAWQAFNFGWGGIEMLLNSCSLLYRRKAKLCFIFLSVQCGFRPVIIYQRTELN